MTALTTRMMPLAALDAKLAADRSRTLQRVLVVSDYPLVRLAVVAILQGQTEFECCGQGTSYDEAFELIRTCDPDLVFLDLSLKNGIGLETVRRMKQHREGLKILVTSYHDDALYAGQALAAGAAGYLHKHAAPEQIAAALRSVSSGQVYLSPELSQQMLCRAVNGQKNQQSDPVHLLTNRELQVFEAIGRGDSTQRIARRLGLSVHTIETYRERIRWKIDAKDGSDMTFRAIVWVLLND